MSDENLRFDYEQTIQQFTMLADIRFKLLAFVPTVTGLAVSLLPGNSQSAPTMLAGGLFNERPARLVLWQWRPGEPEPDPEARPIKVERWHDLGLALVYGAAVGGWIYHVVDSLFTLLGQRIYAASILSGVIVASLFVWVFLRLGSRGKPAPTDELRRLLTKAR